MNRTISTTGSNVSARHLRIDLGALAKRVRRGIDGIGSRLGELNRASTPDAVVDRIVDWGIRQQDERNTQLYGEDYIRARDQRANK